MKAGARQQPASDPLPWVGPLPPSLGLSSKASWLLQLPAAAGDLCGLLLFQKIVCLRPTDNQGLPRYVCDMPGGQLCWLAPCTL